ncbi:glycoside hydrolase family 125 protein [Paenibacillus donghaensis]|uniref:glycoside hydrolase family 125 protein n=1 Tax=Paenibacillus donghaensis TaxID=414771 RepID=UPI00188350F0|nr:glycoside hydrolase family 125 protein [Paenibacillus donghaensis]
MKKYIPTGNEQVAVPLLTECSGRIESINVLHMGYKGIVEIGGDPEKDRPLLAPWIEIGGKAGRLEQLEWHRISDWVPCYIAHVAGPAELQIKGTVLAPVGERGFVYRLTAVNNGQEKLDITLGLEGEWHETKHTINESKPMIGQKFAYKSGWNHSYVFDFRGTSPVFSFAPIFTEPMDIENASVADDSISYRFGKKIELLPGETTSVDFFWGVGFEEVGSTTSAKEMMRKGYDALLSKTAKWLDERRRESGNEVLDRLFNTNLFFNFFYAAGQTLDTEQFVLVTSRSPRYYVSAAYWDRDSLLWSFPSILIADAEYARNMLEYVFSVQIRNVGVHSRYIDGTVLEPGFELDELCAPVIALYNYVKRTGETGIVNEPIFTKGIKRILNILDTKKHPDVALYETFLQPTDDMIIYPYLTYNNVLVVTMLEYLAELMGPFAEESVIRDLKQKAEATRSAILEHCVFEKDGKRMFAWSIDLQGRWNVYDEPPGSLTLLPFYGFCNWDDEIYVNTVEHIRRPEYPFSFAGCTIADIGCEHAPHPWVLSIANSLLSGRKEHFLELLPHLKMDNGIACESVDEHTGECVTGEAFATCAGFLAYAMYVSFYEGGSLTS